MAEKLPPVMPATYSPSSRAIETLGSSTKVSGRTMMMPLLMVIPHFSPNRAVGSRETINLQTRTWAVY